LQVSVFSEERGKRREKPASRGLIEGGKGRKRGKTQSVNPKLRAILKLEKVGGSKERLLLDDWRRTGEGGEDGAMEYRALKKTAYPKYLPKSTTNHRGSETKA